MIVVRVELWSAIDGNVTELARMSLDIQREGKVLRHPRLREHVWNLVAKALTGLGYGGGRE